MINLSAKKLLSKAFVVRVINGAPCAFSYSSSTSNDGKKSSEPKHMSSNLGIASETKKDGGESGWFGNLFVRKLDSVSESQSEFLSDQNHVFELQFHDVRPDVMADYLSAYQTFVNDLRGKSPARLAASWTVEIGDQDRAIHLWQFPGGYPALNEHYRVYRTKTNFSEFRRTRNSMLRSRSNQICLPFSFWPPLSPRGDGQNKHIYELRTYTLKPGTMIEWGNHWVRGIKHRNPEELAVAGLFSHVGKMHMVHHIWAYHDLEHRKKARDMAWRLPGWDECVLHTVPLIRHMNSCILQPTPFSPMQ